MTYFQKSDSNNVDKPKMLSESDQQMLWNRIDKSINMIPAKKRRLRATSWVAAASLMIMIGIGYLFVGNDYVVNKPEVKMLVFETGFNQRSQLILPDSTVIWVNGSSRVEYPETFSDSARIVKLEGEAYFSVCHDSTKPFVVRATGIDVKVLGTQFNVKATGGESEVITTLVKGKVAIKLDSQHQNTVLVPDQQAVFDKISGNMTIASVDTKLFTAWMQGQYKFERELFEVIASHLEKLYGVSFHFMNHWPKSLRYTGTFRYDQSLQEVLMLMKSINAFRFSIQGNEVTIY